MLTISLPMSVLACALFLSAGAIDVAPAPAFDAAIPTTSPVVPLGGQCGGITYKGPTGCEQ
ncbi:hypothetical protein FA15DRAFT_603052 [Coprinopsis marcescibilis]|uniref:CBM1 domain-containing protein n=1 Tax=Coprinopsis marcescibilis TaxID=230819 RepID=A0A5C3KEY4_COPMA|nr:hypothetical protein FA15DRAFT_603052 [Coprinopsis marcescibilis]